MNIIFSSCCLLLLTACGSPEMQLETELKQGMLQAEFDDLLDKEYLLIIPRTGCMGCISAAEQFMLDAYDKHQKQMNILLSDISSFKTARIRFGSEFMNAANVYVDTESIFTEGQLESLYPMIVTLESKEIKAVSLISPENGQALMDFQNSLTSLP